MIHRLFGQFLRLVRAECASHIVVAATPIPLPIASTVATATRQPPPHPPHIALSAHLEHILLITPDFHLAMIAQKDTISRTSAIITALLAGLAPIKAPADLSAV